MFPPNKQFKNNKLRSCATSTWPDYIQPCWDVKGAQTYFCSVTVKDSWSRRWGWLGFFCRLFMVSHLVFGVVWAQSKPMQIDDDTVGLVTRFTNVRQQPHAQSPVVGQLESGTRLQILLDAKGWYQVVLPSGQKAWIWANNVKLQVGKERRSQSVSGDRMTELEQKELPQTYHQEDQLYRQRRLPPIPVNKATSPSRRPWLVKSAVLGSYGLKGLGHELRAGLTVAHLLGRFERFVGLDVQLGLGNQEHISFAPTLSQGIPALSSEALRIHLFFAAPIAWFQAQDSRQTFIGLRTGLQLSPTLLSWRGRLRVAIEGALETWLLGDSTVPVAATGSGVFVYRF